MAVTINPGRTFLDVFKLADLACEMLSHMFSTEPAYMTKITKE